MSVQKYIASFLQCFDTLNFNHWFRLLVLLLLNPMSLSKLQMIDSLLFIINFSFCNFFSNFYHDGEYLFILFGTVYIYRDWSLHFRVDFLSTLNFSATCTIEFCFALLMIFFCECILNSCTFCLNKIIRVIIKNCK